MIPALVNRFRKASFYGRRAILELLAIDTTLEDSDRDKLFRVVITTSDELESLAEELGKVFPVAMWEEGLMSGESTMRKLAAIVLTKMPQPSGKFHPAILALLADDREYYLHSHIISAMEDTGNVPALLELCLENWEKRLGYAASKALDEYFVRAEPATLLEFSRRSDPRVRQLAAGYMAHHYATQWKWGKERGVVIDRLIAMLREDPDLEARKSAAKALSTIAHESRLVSVPAIHALSDSLLTSDSELASNCAWALAGARGQLPESAQTLLVSLVTSRNARLQGAAAAAMAAHKVRSPAARTALIEAISRPPPSEQGYFHSVVKAFGELKIGDPVALAKLRGLRALWGEHYRQIDSSVSESLKVIGSDSCRGAVGTLNP